MNEAGEKVMTGIGKNSIGEQSTKDMYGFPKLFDHCIFAVAHIPHTISMVHNYNDTLQTQMPLESFEFFWSQLKMHNNEFASMEMKSTREIVQAIFLQFQKRNLSI